MDDPDYSKLTSSMREVVEDWLDRNPLCNPVSLRDVLYRVVQEILPDDYKRPE